MATLPHATILIFGARLRPYGSASATMRGRVAAAVAAGRARLGGAVLYVPTGGVARNGVSEAAAMGALLRERGVPAERIVLEPTARDTLESALACAALLAGGGRSGPGGAVLVASSAYHLPRCLVLLRMAGVRARACRPPPGGVRPFWIAREAAALPWDVWQMWRRLRRA